MLNRFSGTSHSQSSAGIKVIHLILGLGFFIAIGILLVLFIRTGNLHFGLVGLALGAFGITLMPSLLNSRGGYDPFQPANFLALTTLMGVTLHTIYIILFDNYNTREFLMLGRSPLFLNRALITINLALLCWFLGYMLRPPNLNLRKRFIVRATFWDKRKLVFIVWLLVIISMVCIFLYMRALGLTVESLATKISGKRRLVVEGADYAFAALGYYLWGASLISYAFYLLVALVAIQRLPLRSSYGIAMMVCGVLACALPFITSSRADILYNIIVGIMIWHYARRPISLQALLTVLIVAVSLFLFIGSLRFNSGQITEETLSLDTEQLMTSFVGSRNWLGVSKTAHIMAAVPERLSYQKGKTMVGWLVAPIPRTMWKDKPIIRTGQLLGPTVFFATRNLTGSPPGFVAELYLNFGIGFVFVGMFFLGYFVKTLYYNSLPLFATHRNALLLYLMIILRFSLDILAGDFNGVMINTLRASITMAIILWFISSKYPHDTRVWKPLGV